MELHICENVPTKHRQHHHVKLYSMLVQLRKCTRDGELKVYELDNIKKKETSFPSCTWSWPNTLLLHPEYTSFGFPSSCLASRRAHGYYREKCTRREERSVVKAWLKSSKHD
ncbi:hypothetical protein VIGAN_UM122200 [Vigna angularis var. angularis]|uniref:Uncharacterized protein n=1 Tax=Vigna angularis var. angularis TaxID=157739 RepID=A0A0S3TEX8_PHAAN|nr:hypothetical protein VIGAN_UM122200 [Vigna angularis var. angularis]